MTHRIKTTLSLAELSANGWIKNPFMWIGDGYLYCPNCKKHQHHFAMSHRLTSEGCEVCEVCNTTTIRRWGHA